MKGKNRELEKSRGVLLRTALKRRAYFTTP